MGGSAFNDEQDLANESSDTEVLTAAESIVFIAGFDEGSNTYYTNAKHFFTEKNETIVSNIRSLEEIINWLNKNPQTNQAYKTIHIVSHSNAWLGMSLKTTPNGLRISAASLSEALQTRVLPILKNGIDKDTNIIFHSCGLGENLALLEVLQKALTNKETPRVYASSFFNIFGGKYAAHYLAKPYYVYYPTAESPGPLALSQVLEKKYSQSEIDWFSALKTRREQQWAEVYSYKFNIPITWDINFEHRKDIPNLDSKDAIMDWVSEAPELAAELYALGIPIEDFRWKANIKGLQLQIKAKTTVICVLEPLLNSDKTEYRQADISDPTLYRLL